MSDLKTLVENYFALKPKTLTKQMLYEIFDEVLNEVSLEDKKGTARDLEQSLVDAANNTTPEKYASLSQLLVSDLGYNSGKMNKNTKPTQFWIDNGGTDTTPKSDFIFGENVKVSLKFGASQFMSGQSGETKATAAAAFDQIQVEPDSTLIDLISELSGKLIFEAPVGELKKALKKGKVDNSLQRDLQVLEGRLKTQERLQNYFDNKVQGNEKFKFYFLKEAMTGNYKFGVDAEQSADHLMVVAGKNIIYDPRYAEKINSSNIKEFYHYDKIDDNIINKYLPLTNLLVKFKTDSEKIAGASGKKIKTGRVKAREVVGLMVSELTEFIEKRKEYINEDVQADFDIIDMKHLNIKDIDTEPEDQLKELFEEFTVKLITKFTQNKNLLEVVNLLGLDYEVVALPQKLDFFSFNQIEE